MFFECEKCRVSYNVDFIGSETPFICKICGNACTESSFEGDRTEKKKHSFRNTKRIFKLSILSILCILLWTVYLWIDLPNKQQLISAAYNIQFIIEKQNKSIRFKQVIHSIPISFDTMPKYLIDALVTMEDRTFFQHYGVTIMTIARPIKQLFSGGKISGGSTITQQLAKNLFFSTDRSLLRKFKELILALKINYIFSKKQVLEMYLNRIYFGKGVHGIEAASRKYFKKKTQDLSSFEVAILIGSIPAPNSYNYIKNKKKARERAQLVLDTMRSINKFQKNKVSSRIHQGKKRCRTIDHIALLDSIKKEIITRLGEQNGVFTVTTTFDPVLQIYAELATHRFVKSDKYKKKHVEEASLIALELSGAVKAMVGSLDRRISTVNHATQSKRQPGSVFKGLVYCSALENGWSPNQNISAQELTINGWSPKNIDNNYPYQITIQDALTHSVNTATVRLMEKVGRKKIISLSNMLETDCRLPNEPGLALGTGECSLIGITKAYATFANQGVLSRPYSILGIHDKIGNILYWYDKSEQKIKHVVSKKNSEILTSMLQQVVKFGTGKNAALSKTKVAGKTGTTQQNRDAWFIGYTNQLVAGVWVGNRDNSPMHGVCGGGLPAIIWRNFMTNTYNETLDRKQFALRNLGSF